METIGVLGKHSRTISWLLFVLGLIGALGLRLVLILNHYNEFYGTIAWYLAIVAYIIFFYYRLIIEDKRRELIIGNNLKKKIINSNLENKDKKILVKLLNSIIISLVRLNFIIILVLSVLALAIDLIIRFWN